MIRRNGYCTQYLPGSRIVCVFCPNLVAGNVRAGEMSSEFHNINLIIL